MVLLPPLLQHPDHANSMNIMRIPRVLPMRVLLRPIVAVLSGMAMPAAQGVAAVITKVLVFMLVFMLAIMVVLLKSQSLAILTGLLVRRMALHHHRTTTGKVTLK